MKRIYVVTIILWCLLLASEAFGQQASHLTSKKSSCSAGTVTFTCPKDFKSLPIESKENLSLLFHRKNNLGLFVAIPESGFNEQKFMSEVVRTALTDMFPKESPEYAWKPFHYTDSVSKYEVSSGMVRGFNGALDVLITYRHIKVNGKEIFVGYVSGLGKGKEAEESFERGAITVDMNGCNASAEVIYSITGEKVDENNLPCSLITPAS